MPNYACKLVDSGGAMTDRSIAAKSMGELYQIMDRSGVRLISAKKPAFNLSLEMDINALLGREVKAKKTTAKRFSNVYSSAGNATQYWYTNVGCA